MTRLNRGTRKFVHIDRRHRRGLQFEARLLTAVFCRPVKPEGILQVLVKRALVSREARHS